MFKFDIGKEWYQRECLMALKGAREQGEQKGLIVMASGLGKTVVAACDVQDFLRENPGRVLYVCHQNGILEQAKNLFQEIFGDKRSYGLFNGQEKQLQPVDFLFASFQSLKKHKSKFSPDEFVYIIVDEAHHIPAPTFKATVEYFQPQFMLGLTATPDRMDRLDLEPILGETVFDFDLFQAMMQGCLPKVDYHILTDEIAGLENFLDRESGERISLTELNRRVFIPLRDERIVELIESASRIKKDPRTIVFCASIKHAEIIASLIKGAAVLHCDRPDDEQKQCLRKFRNGTIKTLVAVNMLNEGIDVPAVDMLVFLRQTASPVVLLQQLGRGLRQTPEKESVLVLDFVANCQRLEMIWAMQDKIREYPQSPQIPTDEDRVKAEARFVVNIAEPKFEAHKVDILELVARARNWHYTKQELILQLQKKAAELGRTPLRKELKGDPLIASRGAYARIFGSYNAALKEAGLELNFESSSYTSDELLEQLRRKATELGRAPTTREVSGDPTMASVAVFVRFFGSYNEAIKAVGLKAKVLWGAVCTTDEALEQLRKKATELGRAPTINEINADPAMISSATFRKLFGSYKTALNAVGLDVSPKSRRFTSDQLLEQLQRKAADLGRTPTAAEINDDPTIPSNTAYTNAFGSFAKACKAAGLEPNKRATYLTSELIEQLRQKAQQLGRAPTRNEIDEDKTMAGIATFSNRFGNYVAICKAAGLEPNPVGLQQS